MAEGWRNRFMAPVYALVISFGLVFILGAVLDDPTRIQFTIPEQSGTNEQIKALQNVRVQVKTADDKRELADEQLGRSLGFTLLNPHENIRICTTLPPDWSSAAPVEPGTSEESCWVRTQCHLA